MSSGRLVPWCSWQEWQQVGSWLLSPDRQEQQRGIDRVAAWRCRGRVPLGVDISASLTETRLRDPWYCPPGTIMPLGTTDSGLRGEYSLAIVRMVNGIADSAQRGRVAASVAQLAAAAGLPRMLVDLRHEASHNELPALPALRLGADAALTWLQGGYWAAQQDMLDSAESRAYVVLKEYLELRFASAAAASATTAAGRQAAVEDDGGEEDHRTNAGQQEAEGFNASAAQKRRRALMAELRSLLPAPAIHLLLPALLDSEPGLLDPPAMPVSSSNGDSGPSALGAASGSSVPSGTAGDTCGSREWAAWRSNLQPLLVQWPQLGGLLLGAALQRLKGAVGALGLPATRHGDSEAIPKQQRQQQQQHVVRCALLMSGWVAGLLSFGQPPQQQQQQRRRANKQQQGKRRQLAAAAVPDKPGTASREGEGGALSGWSPTPKQTAQAAQLLLQLQRGLAAVARERTQQVVSAATDMAPEPPSAIAGVLTAVQGALEVAAAAPDLETAAAKAVAAGLRFMTLALPGQATTGAHVVDMEEEGQTPAPEPEPCGGDDVLAPLEQALQAAWARQEQLLRMLRDGSQQQPQRPAATEAVAEGASPPRKRFRLVGEWLPCAIGLLPDAFDPNGRLPDLAWP